MGNDGAGGTDSPELTALHGLRDGARALLALEADVTLPDDALAPARAALAGSYRAYVARWGPLNRGVLHEGQVDAQTGLPTLAWRRPALGGFRRDPDYFTVMALEVYDPATGTATPAPILTRRVHGRAEPARRVTSVPEALAVCRAEGGVDPARVAELLGLRDTNEAIARLGEHVFRDPERGGTWVPASDYLTGDVRAKHAAARLAARDDPTYRRNVDALAGAIPTDVGPLEISVSLGAPWVAAEDVEAFVHEVLHARVKVWHLPSAASWRIVAMGRKTATAYDTARLSALDLLTAGLNGRSPVVVDRIRLTGRTIQRRNMAESIAAQAKLTALQERFRTWIWEDAHRAERLCAEYNRRFNTHVVHRTDGSLLTFPGLADGIELWPWQRDIVARIVSSPATLCAHAVGAGKTRSMVCAALTTRRLGLARKPLIAVPAHLVEQVAREARQAYPFGRFLVAGEAGPSAQLAARCATGDWDAVIMSHGSFSALPVAPQAELDSLLRTRAELERQLRAGLGGKHGRSVLRRRLAVLDARAERVRTTPRPPVTFDDLGVDLLLVDEAHYFKRLPVISRMEGISLGSSQRAADLHLKASLLRARRGSLPSLALFTGTPWSNTIAETFVWQSFVQPDVLAAAGIEHFDAWAAVFVDYADVVELTPDGSDVRVTQRPSRIRNLAELRRMLAQSADVLPADALGLARPERVSATIVCEPSPGQAAYVRALGGRVDKIRREHVRSERGGDNMLAVCGDGRRAALDPRLVGVAEASTKIAAVADSVARVHDQHAGVRYPGSDVAGVFQLVFCDQGTPGVDGTQTYGRLRIELVRRGIPAERVRWVHDARSPAARAQLIADCRSGDVSVLIGSTDTLGVGTNVQARLRAIHHVDAPWRPSDIEQREGRAFRPGNLNPVVDVLRYVTKGTFDAYMWQTLQRKAGFVEQLYRADPGTRAIDDVGETVLTFAEVKALAAGNALLLDQARAAADLARLRLLRSIDAQTVTAARRRLADAEQDEYRLHQQELMLRSAQDRITAPDDATELRAALAAVRERLGRAGDPAPVRAPWRGLGVELVPEGGWPSSEPEPILVRVTLAHRRVDELRVSVGALRSVPARLRRWAEHLDERIVELARDTEHAHEAGVDAKHVIAGHRFAQSDELAAAEAYLADINTALEASIGAKDINAA